MPEANVTSFSEAARVKECHRSTLYRAARRGDLTTVQVGSVEMLLRDEAFAEWTPRETGGRLHERYQAKQQKGA